MSKEISIRLEATLLIINEFISSLREFENLQNECQQISDLYLNVNQLVVEQAPMVEAIAENVEVTEIQVEEGTRHLQQALNYKKTIYPVSLILNVCDMNFNLSFLDSWRLYRCMHAGPGGLSGWS